jgi:hypothetical protein
MTRRDYICRQCQIVYEVETIFGESLEEVVCDQCRDVCKRYFGNQEVLMNFGFVERKYSNKVDRDIAEYQFTHL